MQYVIAEECYAATFPPTAHSPSPSPSPSSSPPSLSPPSSPSPTPRARLEEDQGSEAVQKIEAALSHVQLHLTFQQKATLTLLQREYAQFAHVAELYIYAVHFLVDGWYREAVVALLLAVNHEHHKLMYLDLLIITLLFPLPLAVTLCLDYVRYSLAQNSRANEIRRVLPACVRRLSAQAAELLASAQVNAHADAPSPCVAPLRQALDLAKMVVIGSSIALEMRSAVNSTTPTHPASPLLRSFSAAPTSLLHQVLNQSDSPNVKRNDTMESTQDLLAIWENVAVNCTDSSGNSLLSSPFFPLCPALFVFVFFSYLFCFVLFYWIDANIIFQFVGCVKRS